MELTLEAVALFALKLVHETDGALAVRDGSLGKLAVERADGAGILTSPLGHALKAAGFHATPRGLRLRG